MLSTRETIFSILSQTSRLQDALHAGPKDVRTFEVKALLKSSEICRQHHALQESLASATYLSDLVGPCKEMGLPIDAPAQFEIACVLWEQGETTSAIRMLDEIDAPSYSEDESGSFIKSKLLVKLVSRVQVPKLIITDEHLRVNSQPKLGCRNRTRLCVIFSDQPLTSWAGRPLVMQQGKLSTHSPHSATNNYKTLQPPKT